MKKVHFFSNKLIKAAIAKAIYGKLRIIKKATTVVDKLFPPAVSETGKAITENPNIFGTASNTVGATKAVLQWDPVRNRLIKVIPDSGAWLKGAPSGILNRVNSVVALPSNVMGIYNGVNGTIDAGRRLYNAKDPWIDGADAAVDLLSNAANTYGGAASTAINLTNTFMPGTQLATALATNPYVAYAGPAAAMFATTYGTTRALDKKYGHDVATAYQSFRNKARHGMSIDAYTEPDLDAWDVIDTALQYPGKSVKGIVGGVTYTQAIAPYIQNAKEKHLIEMTEMLKSKGYSGVDLDRALRYIDEEFDRKIAYDPEELARYMYEADTKRPVITRIMGPKFDVTGIPEYIAAKLKGTTKEGLVDAAHERFAQEELARRQYSANTFFTRFNSAARNTAILTMDPSTKRSLIRAGVDVRSLMQHAYEEDLAAKKKLADAGIYVDNRRPIPAQMYLHGVVSNPTREGAKRAMRDIKEQWAYNNNENIIKGHEWVQRNGGTIPEWLAANGTPYNPPVELDDLNEDGTRRYIYNRFKEDDEGKGMRDFLSGSHLDVKLRKGNNPERENYEATGTFGKLNDDLDAQFNSYYLSKSDLGKYMKKNKVDAMSLAKAESDINPFGPTVPF